MREHVLVVMPHPDDETLSCGGTLALYASRGIPVTYACGTKGEMGRMMGRPFFATRENLPELREKELREACAALGINLRFLGFRDKTIEFLDPDMVTGKITELIEELKPTLVITYHPVHGVHPDHCALGAATVRALAKIPPEKRPPLHTRGGGAGIKELGEPDLVVDITPVLHKKEAAMRAHRSQTEVIFANQEARWAKDPEAKRRWEEQRTKESFWIYKFE